MKTLWISIMLSAVLALSVGCGKKDEDKGGAKADEGKTPPAKAETPPAKAETPKADPAAAAVKPEMKTFMGLLDGKSDSVTAALKAHGAEGLDGKDMDMYNLEKATVTKTEGDCYTMDAKSGMTTRTYVLCWKDGKIASVEDKGMR